MSKPKMNQTTNQRLGYCGCTNNGVKHNVPVPAGTGHIVREHNGNYFIYCPECHSKIFKQNATNNKIATMKGETIEKSTINDGWQHQFTFYINNKHFEAINVLKRLHYTIAKGTPTTTKVISPKETNLNGLQKNFTNIINNLGVKDSLRVTITTTNMFDKAYKTTTKATLKTAIESAKQQRENIL